MSFHLWWTEFVLKYDISYHYAGSFFTPFRNEEPPLIETAFLKRFLFPFRWVVDIYIVAQNVILMFLEGGFWENISNVLQ